MRFLWHAPCGPVHRLGQPRLRLPDGSGQGEFRHFCTQGCLQISRRDEVLAQVSTEKCGRIAVHQRANAFSVVSIEAWRHCLQVFDGAALVVRARPEAVITAAMKETVEISARERAALAQGQVGQGRQSGKAKVGWLPQPRPASRWPVSILLFKKKRNYPSRRRPTTLQNASVAEIFW